MISKLFVALFSFVLLYFAYLGFTTTPVQLGEVDSLTYHIPVAESISRGNFVDLSHIKQGLGYYPAVGEIVLSLFIKLNIPLNLFNVLGLVLLFFGCRHAARVFGLSKITSLVFATTFSLLPTVLRLVLTQTIDIWLAVFFLWSLSLLQKPRQSVSYFLKIGFSLGLLVGVKYSGILLTLALLVVYSRKLFSVLTTRRIIVFSIPFFILGLSWYVRNWIVAGNPIYPVAFLNLQADPNFHATDWTSIKVLFEPGGFWLMTQALVSEYLFWSLAPLLAILISFYSKIKKRKELLKNLMPLVVLAVINFIIFLPQPSLFNAQIVVSNMRFVYPAMIPLMLFMFLVAKRLRILKEIAIIALLSSISVLPQLEYMPKLVIVWLIVIATIFVAPQKILKLLNIRKA
jgi:hypothetical protein